MNQLELKEILEYFPETGLFIRKSYSKQHKQRIGKDTGYPIHEGYVAIKINNKRYLAHKLAMLYMTGSFPIGETDHINGIRSDNRWENLRTVDKQTNLKNRCIPCNNKSGVIGVCWDKRSQKWLAQISTGITRKHLGYFNELSDALEARKNAERIYGYHINHGKILP